MHETVSTSSTELNQLSKKPLVQLHFTLRLLQPSPNGIPYTRSLTVFRFHRRSCFVSTSRVHVNAKYHTYGSVDQVGSLCLSGKVKSYRSR